jgi:hypothetical protein
MFMTLLTFCSNQFHDINIKRTRKVYTDYSYEDLSTPWFPDKNEGCHSIPVDRSADERVPVLRRAPSCGPDSKSAFTVTIC